MSTPDQPATTAAPPGRPEWLSEADTNAIMESAFWFDMNATAELIKPYKGMHVAIYGKAIVDGDCDKHALYRRLDADLEAFPPNRVLVRYIPTDEEAWSQLWRH